MKRALLVVDHGSRRPQANEMLEGVAELLRKESGGTYFCVEYAHMELAEPSIATAFAKCVEAGAELVVVSLFFLSPGRHSKSDIPELVAEAASQYPGVEAIVAAPLGMDTRLASLLLQRADEAMQCHHAGGGKGQALVR